VPPRVALAGFDPGKVANVSSFVLRHLRVCRCVSFVSVVGKQFREPIVPTKSGSLLRPLNVVVLEVVGTIRHRCIPRSWVVLGAAVAVEHRAGRVSRCAQGQIEGVGGPTGADAPGPPPEVPGPRSAEFGARAPNWELPGVAQSAIKVNYSCSLFRKLGPRALTLIRRACLACLGRRRAKALEFGLLVLIEHPSRFLTVVVCLFGRRLGGVHSFISTFSCSG
jgi:hypothetical protein